MTPEFALNSINATLGHCLSSHCLLPTGVSPSKPPRSRGLRAEALGEKQAQNTTFLPRCRGRFGLPCAAFGRPYSRHRCCFLFLGVLRCFSSPGSRPSRANSGIPGSKAACAYPGLIAACHALRRPPSPAIHQTASLQFRRKARRVTLACSPATGPTARHRQQEHENAHRLRFRHQGVALASSCSGFARARSRSTATLPLVFCTEGGDLAAGSPTATLLRLSPSHEAQIRRNPL